MFECLTGLDTTSPLSHLAGIDEVLLKATKLIGTQALKPLRENITQGGHPMRLPLYRILNTFAQKVPQVAWMRCISNQGAEVDIDHRQGTWNESATLPGGDTLPVYHLPSRPHLSSVMLRIANSTHPAVQAECYINIICVIARMCREHGLDGSAEGPFCEGC
jgi:hypothetical protein